MAELRTHKVRSGGGTWSLHPGPFKARCGYLTPRKRARVRWRDVTCWNCTEAWNRDRECRALEDGDA
jgi:hypothetical protein